MPTIAEWFADATAAPGAGRLFLAHRTAVEFLVLVIWSECEQLSYSEQCTSDRD